MLKLCQLPVFVFVETPHSELKLKRMRVVLVGTTGMGRLYVNPGFIFLMVSSQHDLLPPPRNPNNHPGLRPKS